MRVLGFSQSAALSRFAGFIRPAPCGTVLRAAPATDLYRAELFWYRVLTCLKMQSITEALLKVR